MIENVTDVAVYRLQLMAEAYKFQQDKVVFQIDAKMRYPCQLIWYITPVAIAPANYITKQMKGITFAVESKAALYLVGVEIDWHEKLLHDKDLYAPTTINQLGKPVWPRGYVFEHQKVQYIQT